MTRIALEQVRIASPCPARWDQMDGDATTRFCHHCQKHVYNLVEMKRDEIEDLIVRTEGRFCGRLYQRADGTTLVGDCPVGLARLRRNLRRRIGRIAAVLLLVLGGVGYTRARETVTREPWFPATCNPLLAKIYCWTYGEPRPIVMGDIAFPTAPTTQPE
jgi:hypothetical protein